MDFAAIFSERIVIFDIKIIIKSKRRYALSGGNVMKKSSKIPEDRFKILESFLGFLGVIIALFMQIGWEFISKETEQVSKYGEAYRLLAILNYFLCIFILISICGFYFMRIMNQQRSAEILALIILGLTGFTFLLGLPPVIDILFSRSISGAEFGIQVLMIIDSLMILVIFAVLALLLIYANKIWKEYGTKPE